VRGRSSRPPISKAAAVSHCLLQARRLGNHPARQVTGTHLGPYEIAEPFGLVSIHRMLTSLFVIATTAVVPNTRILRGQWRIATSRDFENLRNDLSVIARETPTTTP
jgi:hypothetical protein